MAKIAKTVSMGLIVCLILIASSAFAGKHQKYGGFTGEGSYNEKIVTVEQAKKLRDDASVTLEGRITKQLGHEKYIFEDNTGSIKIEIDDKDWRGVTVNSDDFVRIYGEVDKDHGKIEIEVDYIEKINSGKGTEPSKKSSPTEKK